MLLETNTNTNVETNINHYTLTGPKSGGGAVEILGGPVENCGKNFRTPVKKYEKSKFERF